MTWFFIFASCKACLWLALPYLQCMAMMSSRKEDIQQWQDQFHDYILEHLPAWLI